jgi:hypothetical protein
MDPTRPRTRTQLKTFLKDRMALEIPDRRVCPAHDRPVDYLWRGFDQPRDFLVWANRGGGKSMMASVLTCLEAIFDAGGETILLGGSLEQSERVGNYVRRMLDPLEVIDEKGSVKRRIRLTNGSVIHILPQSQTAVRGAHVQRVRCDEVELFDPGVWQAVQFCTLGSARSAGALDVLSTAHVSGGLMERLIASAVRENPPARRGRGARAGARTVHRGGFRLIRWCLWEVIEHCSAGRSCEGCPLADDCGGRARKARGFFPIDDAIAIKARSSRAAWEAEMLCRGPRREHRVFGQFDEGVHVGPVPFQPDWPVFRAIDFGYADPLVCLWIQLTPGGEVRVFDEYVRSREPLARHAAEILRRDPPGARVAATYVDPAGQARESISGAACTELLAAAGIPCTSRGSTIAEGLELIRAALAPAAGEPSLRIDPCCRRLIAAFRNYHYPAPGSAGRADTPVKDGPDHAIDALRYFFVNRKRPGGAIRRSLY